MKVRQSLNLNDGVDCNSRSVLQLSGGRDSSRDEPQLLQENGAHACGSEHFDSKALVVIADIVKRLQQGEVDGCLGPQDDWLSGTYFPRP